MLNICRRNRIAVERHYGIRELVAFVRLHPGLYAAAACKPCKDQHRRQYSACTYNSFFHTVHFNPGSTVWNVTPASEEDRDAEMTFEIVGGLFLAQQIDVKQVVTKIQV
jgi:hypothetical protein